jgi:hypothetical protein
MNATVASVLILSPRLEARWLREGAGEGLGRGDCLWDQDCGGSRRRAPVGRRMRFRAWTAHETAHDRRRGRSDLRITTCSAAAPDVVRAPIAP